MNKNSELESVNEKLRQIYKVYFPLFFIIATPIFFYLIVYVFFEAFFIYLGLLFGLLYYGHINLKIGNKLTYQCWYSEKMFLKNKNVGLLNIFAVSIGVLVTCLIFTIVHRDIFYIKWGLLTMAIWIPFILFFLYIWRSGRIIHKSKAISKRFHIDYENMERNVEQSLADSGIKFKKKKEKSKWYGTYTTVFSILVCGFTIQILERGKNTTRIRFNPVKMDNLNEVRKIQQHIDEQI